MSVARAIWKGTIALGEHGVPVRMYSAVQDRKVHFRLLHAADLAPVAQRIVRKTDGEEVPKEERRKAFPIDADTAVILQPDELEALEPDTSRDIRLCGFVPVRAVSEQWYERPYHLGPDGDDERYFALVESIEARRAVGIARWVMRGKRYLGALRASAGYLALITLRRADQVLSVAVDAASQRPDEKELKLAEQLVASIADDFRPDEWRDEYRERVAQLIEAKRRGEAVKLPAPKRRRASGGLADQLRQSIAAARERKVA